MIHLLRFVGGCALIIPALAPGSKRTGTRHPSHKAADNVAAEHIGARGGKKNSFFEIVGPLLSRSRLFRLQPLTPDDILALLCRALADPERGYGEPSEEGYEAEIKEWVARWRTVGQE